MKSETDIQYLKGVGDVRARLFKKLGIDTFMALLRFYPRAYEDWSKIYSANEAPENINCCIRGTVAFPCETRRIAGGRIMAKTAVTDGDESVNIIFFNNKYVAANLKEGEEYTFFGKIEKDRYSGGKQMISPQFLKADSTETGLRPIYRQTEKLNSRTVAKCVKNALTAVKEDLVETLPDYIVKKYKLLPLYEALEKIHFPNSEKDIAAARRRLAFEELFILELGLALMRPEKTGGTVINDYFNEFKKLLPFELTDSQQKTINQCLRDMQGGGVMRRLVQGDVGSGKTAVAAAVVYSCIKSGYQAAMMAPTEVLAGQHYRTFLSFFENTNIKIAVLTGSMTKKSKDEVKKRLASGEIDFVIGTHALIQKDVEFKNTALVITDEQHRFGVNQRNALADKGIKPHMLVMSATPIPRTLGLIIYGDMDISVISELPKGRIPIDTFCVTCDYRQRIYKFLEKHFDEGRQGYIICPLADEGAEETELIPAEDYYKYLQTEVFPNRRLGLLYGKMKPIDKDRVMADFSDGKIDLLVSTTVVEVGVDVPNAAVMIIENADRFGLSQLHQLRGRIGRGNFKSTCVLVSDNENADTAARLKIICNSRDGFKIADEDLKLRGPGDFFGERQHGLPLLKIADIVNDSRILSAAKDIADEITEEDPDLSKPENRILKKSVTELFGDVNNLN